MIHVERKVVRKYYLDVSSVGPLSIVFFGFVLLLAVFFGADEVPPFGKVAKRERVIWVGSIIMGLGAIWWLVGIIGGPANDDFSIDYLLVDLETDPALILRQLPAEYESYGIVPNEGDWFSVDRDRTAEVAGVALDEGNYCTDEGQCLGRLFLVVTNASSERLIEPSVSWHIQVENGTDQQFLPPARLRVDDKQSLSDLAIGDGVLLPLGIVQYTSMSRFEGIELPLNSIGDVRYPVRLQYRSAKDGELQFPVRPPAESFTIRGSDSLYGQGG